MLADRKFRHSVGTHSLGWALPMSFLRADVVTGEQCSPVTTLKPSDPLFCGLPVHLQLPIMSLSSRSSFMEIRIKIEGTDT